GFGFYRFDLVFEVLAHRARLGVELANELDERIVRRVDRLLSTFEQLLAHCQVVELRALDHPLRELFGRLFAEHLLDERIVGAELLARLLEREREGEDLELLEDGGRREELLLESREPRLGVLLEALLVRLRHLVARAHEPAPEREQLAAEAVFALQILVA